MDKTDRLINFFPAFYQASHNPVLNGLLKAIGQEDQRAGVQLDETKNQLFVRFASGSYLNALGRNVGVSRPTVYPTNDTVFRAAIPILSYYPKQIKKTIYELFELYWGSEYIRSTVTARNPGPYSILDGQTLCVKVDNGEEHTITFNSSDFVDPMFAELDEIIEKIDYYQLPLIASVYTALNGKQYLRIQTKTLGGGGAIQITSNSTAIVFNFYNGKIKNTRCGVYEINTNELIIKCPESIPLTTTLKGSNHFHASATIYDGSPATLADPYWPSSYLYDTVTPTQLYTLTSVKTTLNQNIEKGKVYNRILVADSSNFSENGGMCVINFGSNTEEAMVPFVRRLGATSLFLDAAYTFQYDHILGENINVIVMSHYQPRVTGEDYAFYLNDTAVSEALMILLLDLIKAAGVVLRFQIGDLTVSVNEFGPTYDIGWFGDARMTTSQRNIMTSGWGISNRGSTWFNTTTRQWEGWDGIGIVILG